MDDGRWTMDYSRNIQSRNIVNHLGAHSSSEEDDESLFPVYNTSLVYVNRL